MLPGTVIPNTAVLLVVSVLHPTRTAKVINKYVIRIYLFLYFI